MVLCMPHFMEPAELPVRELIEEFNWDEPLWEDGRNGQLR
jgi:hypothetical protein